MNVKIITMFISLEKLDHKYVAVTDLGADKIVTYTFGVEGFKEHAVSEFHTEDGPRHIEFHNNGKYAYVVHELSNRVSVVQYHDGKFEEIERHLTILKILLEKLN